MEVSLSTGMGLDLDSHKSPFEPKPFYDSMIYRGSGLTLHRLPKFAVEPLFLEILKRETCNCCCQPQFEPGGEETRQLPEVPSNLSHSVVLLSEEIRVSEILPVFQHSLSPWSIHCSAALRQTPASSPSFPASPQITLGSLSHSAQAFPRLLLCRVTGVGGRHVNSSPAAVLQQLSRTAWDATIQEKRPTNTATCAEVKYKWSYKKK